MVLVLCRGVNFSLSEWCPIEDCRTWLSVLLQHSGPFRESGGFYTVVLKTSTTGSAYPLRRCVLIPAFGSICFSCNCCDVMVVIKTLAQILGTKLAKLRIYTSYGLVTPPLLIPQGSKYQKPQIPKAPKLFTAVIPETDADLLGQSVRVLPNQDLEMSLFHSTVTWSITYCD